jgi:RimJ/RimL family protein N-acetyltransferase
LGAGVVYCEAYVGNHASRTVAERVGFTIYPGTVSGRHGQKWSGRLLPGNLRRADPVSR